MHERVNEIRAQIDDLTSELMTIINNDAAISTGWVVLMKGVGRDSDITMTNIFQSQGCDIITMSGLVRLGEFHVDRRLNLAHEA